MATVLPSINETQLFTALRGVLLELVDCEVLRGPINRAAMPKGDFIVMLPADQTALSTNVTTYAATTKSVVRSTQWSAQLDCYGKLSGDRAQVIATMLRDDWACERFAALDPDVQPLYATDAKQLPLVTGEQQYEQRWMLEVRLAYKPAVTVQQESAIALEIGLIDVDERHKP